MQIIREETYISNLEPILEYIAQDSFNKAFDFLSKLDNKITNIVNMPYKYRQSLYYNDTNIRDLIFKGYTIIYIIDLENKTIAIIDIFKWINK
ncbi:type II toxin-antitoxin system RelE/ParE family toxin [Sulfurimonas sp.]|uniref:type II toxin-antitoxin system RelE/ParE family toxin n=1 Tax=Sulfurimonas sp. TaxID=2022749 RepID=UPI002615DBAD|nr:type II toxin-antitoxin system RelE/ParE family toxin [Sulfurimonas sp.]